MPKKKAKSIAKLVDEAAVLLQKYVRMKAADDQGYCKCVSCGKIDHYKDMDGGHFIPREAKSVKILEENIHPQCKRCNGFYKEEAKIGYTHYMQEMYGQNFIDELLRLRSQPKKYYRGEVEEIKTELKQKIKEQQERLGV